MLDWVAVFYNALVNTGLSGTAAIRAVYESMGRLVAQHPAAFDAACRAYTWFGHFVR